MRLKVNQNGIVCNKCSDREMVYYRAKGENIGHLLCSACNNLMPMSRGCYSDLDNIALDIYEKGNYETREIWVNAKEGVK